MARPTFPLWILASGVLMLIGAITPWASAFGVTIDGLDGDGAIILVGGIVAVVLGIILMRTARRPRPLWALIVCVLAGMACAATASYDWASLEGVVGTAGLTDAEETLLVSVVSVGWGLVLSALASASLLAASVTGFVTRRGESPAPAPVPAPAPAE